MIQPGFPPLFLSSNMYEAEQEHISCLSQPRLSVEWTVRKRQHHLPLLLHQLRRADVDATAAKNAEGPSPPPTARLIIAGISPGPYSMKLSTCVHTVSLSQPWIESSRWLGTLSPVGFSQPRPVQNSSTIGCSRVLLLTNFRLTRSGHLLEPRSGWFG